MKYEIDTKKVTQKMALIRGLKGKRHATAKSLRVAGMSRTETDSLAKEGAELSLSAICILSNELLCDPLHLIANPSELYDQLPRAYQKGSPAKVLHQNPNYTFTDIGSKQKTYLIEALDSDEIKSQYMCCIIRS